MTNTDILTTDPVPLIDRIKEAIDDRRYDLEAGRHWMDAGREFVDVVKTLLGRRYNVVWAEENGSTTYAFGGRMICCSTEDMTLDWPPDWKGYQVVRRIPWDSIRSLKRVG